jgi:hypothetical protein
MSTQVFEEQHWLAGHAYNNRVICVEIQSVTAGRQSHVNVQTE